jgi:hypothetical protein
MATVIAALIAFFVEVFLVALLVAPDWTLQQLRRPLKSARSTDDRREAGRPVRPLDGIIVHG